MGANGGGNNRSDHLLTTDYVKVSLFCVSLLLYRRIYGNVLCSVIRNSVKCFIMANLGVGAVESVDINDSIYCSYCTGYVLKAEIVR